ncbi:hypothetical protein B0H19DRAFT_1261435 [Mycena capillaripes]|nr:hypothetical protein B0H19DRAFT_1261435 [Mycena capillaripes]
MVSTRRAACIWDRLRHLPIWRRRSPTPILHPLPIVSICFHVLICCIPFLRTRASPPIRPIVFPLMGIPPSTASSQARGAGDAVFSCAPCVTASACEGYEC